MVGFEEIARFEVGAELDRRTAAESISFSLKPLAQQRSCCFTHLVAALNEILVVLILLGIELGKVEDVGSKVAAISLILLVN